MPDISSRAGAVEETTGPRRTLRRSLLIATICFGVLVLANLAIFGLLALRSVSERVLRETLVHTQEDADDLARRIEAQLQEAIQPLKWVKTKEVVDTFLNERDTRREIYNRIVIFDSDGNVLQTWEDHQSGLILTPPSLLPIPDPC